MLTKLEDKLEAVLNLTRAFGEGGEARVLMNDLPCDDVVELTAGRIRTTGIRQSAIDVRIETSSCVATEISVVKQVEEVEPKLESQSLAPQAPVLVDRQVGVDI